MTELLRVEHLSKFFAGRGRARNRGSRAYVRALDDVSFSVAGGETLAVVGESGSGKSTLARCVTRLLDPSAGSIYFDGRDITALRGADLRLWRRQVAIVFQDPFASLDPRQKVGAIVGEPLRVQNAGTRAERDERVRALLVAVGLDTEHAGRYPHQFSGGQRQRIGIARALALEPRLVVLDEPVSALDVSVQAQILNLLKDLQSELGLTYLFISHDLGVVHFMADRIVVMHRGRIVENAARDKLFANPQHPYTEELLAAVPEPDPDLGSELAVAASGGEEPAAAGCSYSSRCRYAEPRCSTEVPILSSLEGGGKVACHFPLASAQHAPVVNTGPADSSTR